MKGVAYAGAALMLGALSSGVSAGFIGHTVSADQHFPFLGNPIRFSGQAVAGAGVEFNDIGGFGVGLSPAVDFSDTRIVLSYPDGQNLVPPATFDGFVFTDFSAADIIGVSLNFSSVPGFDASRLSFDGNHVYANLAGLANFAGPVEIQIDVQFADEPVTLGLMLTGLGVLGFLARRRKAQHA